ncbi:hypothetical protein GH742_14280 [Legionella sp. MW5194]|uniref:hypothetical protein n=1 Tax=Legionella sp. MW5194 TaxID=2662448 RepID=UPI00193D3070|nr:hypothetical protein [Legionella sp. MW5194]QRN04935.1 hypothetical protein GH742_14280 [Legionella sp. MW5194]
MTEVNPKTADTQNDSDETVYLIAGRMDAQSRLLAKWLHTNGKIYLAYACLDGWNLSYSTLKYFFDVALTNSDRSSSDVMHEWLMSPAGIAVAATESITLIVFAMLATHFDDNPDKLKRFIAVVWPYCRDTMKGLKNAYKGVRSTIQMLDVLGGTNLNFLMLPLALALGGIAIANRLWFRYMLSQRKDMMKANKLLLDEIQNAEFLSKEECQLLREKIQRQTLNTRRAALFSAALGGAIDSLYLYVGILFLAPTAWPVFVTLSVFCMVFSLICIATRIYEEYDFQKKLLIAQAKVELALYSKEHGQEIIELLNELQRLSIELSKFAPTEQNNEAIQKLEEERNALSRQIHHIKQEFESKREELQSLLTLSYTSAFLAGAKNGLAAFSAVTSILFTLGTVFVLAGAPFPPLLLILGAGLGMALLIGFISQSLIQNWRHHQTLKGREKPYEPLAEMLEKIKDIKNSAQEMNVDEEVKSAIHSGLTLDYSPQYFFQEWFEVVRSFFSGLGKGSKAVDYSMNPLQEMNDKGHYQDTPVMLGVSAVMSLFYAAVLALRALARGFGRPPLDQMPLIKETDSEARPDSPLLINEEGASDEEQDAPGMELPSTDSSRREPNPPVKKFGSRSNLTSSWPGFFTPSQSKPIPIPHRTSSQPSHFNDDDTSPGLN